MVPFTSEFRATFADTDAAGIVHFTTVLFWVEATEEALFRDLKLPFFTQQGASVKGFPRVRIECDYKAPIYREDVVTLALHPRELGDKKIIWSFTALVQGREVAVGSLISVYAYREGDGAMAAALIPSATLAGLRQFFKVS
jgi:acyl-CoA thioesterase FadM